MSRPELPAIAVDEPPASQPRARATQRSEPPSEQQPWPSDPRGATPEAQWRAALSAARLPSLDVAERPPGRLIVLAAHPDDETLGAGGLIHTAAEWGWRVDVVVATAGEASHPGSATHSPQRLARIRRAEAVAAVAALAPAARVVQLDHPDGGLADREGALIADLVRVIADHPATDDPSGRSGTLVAAPWRGDRHPDHEAAGRAAAIACVRTDSDLLEYPIWLWHWGCPADAPWAQLRELRLDGAARRAKYTAVRAYASQIAPLSAAPGDGMLLPPAILERFDRETEAFVHAQPRPDDTLDRLHAQVDDPWHTATSEYEIAKRDATCAALPARRYRRVLDVGCSIGLLTAQLARRAERVLAVDASPVALRAAADRLDEPNVDLRLLRVPQEWPEGRFDLVVVSEVGYFLSPAQLTGLVAAVRRSLEPGGVVVLCHWRHELVGWPLDADAVHAAFAREFTPLAADPSDDYLLDVYAADRP